MPAKSIRPLRFIRSCASERWECAQCTWLRVEMVRDCLCSESPASIDIGHLKHPPMSFSLNLRSAKTIPMMAFCSLGWAKGSISDTNGSLADGLLTLTPVPWFGPSMNGEASVTVNLVLLRFPHLNVSSSQFRHTNLFLGGPSTVFGRRRRFNGSCYWWVRTRERLIMFEYCNSSSCFRTTLCCADIHVAWLPLGRLYS